MIPVCDAILFKQWLRPLTLFNRTNVIHMTTFVSRKISYILYSVVTVTVDRTLYAVIICWRVRTTVPQLSNGVIMTKVILSN